MTIEEPTPEQIARDKYHGLYNNDLYLAMSAEFEQHRTDHAVAIHGVAVQDAALELCGYPFPESKLLILLALSPQYRASELRTIVAFLALFVGAK